MCHDSEYAIGKLHDPQRVLESLVRGPRIHKTRLVSASW